MKFLVVDDEPLQMKRLTDMLHQLKPNVRILSCSWAEDALEIAEQNIIDVAFLDIQLGSFSGLELAVRLKNYNPRIHIIFVTGYRDYAVDAYAMHATGYLLKPVTEEALLRELTFIYGEEPASSSIRIQTFGGFEVFSNGVPIKFERKKAKELLAFLVDKRGASVTTAEACNVLFEEEEYNSSKQAYFRNIVRSLRVSLKNAGAEHILVRHFNYLAVLQGTFDCDYYRFLSGDPIAINSYQNDYMPGYSWAEFRNGQIFFEKGNKSENG